MSAKDDWKLFREKRNTELPAPHGWLSLTSLQWLPAEPGALELVPGTWSADDVAAHLSATDSDELVLASSGEPLAGNVSAELSEDDSLDWVRYGSVLVELARRGGKYAIRTRDSASPILQGFSGVPVFDYHPGAAVEATFSPFESPETLNIETANPHVRGEATFAGTLKFLLAGADHKLLAQQDGDKLLVNFSDASSGHETAAWRFVRTHALTAEQLHGEQPITVDFNYALNWPSGFTAFGTCPKPVAENALPVPVLAGEKLLGK